MTIDRSFFGSLQEWAKRASRKPLVLMGARQVGKTQGMKWLSQQGFANNLYLNFEENPEAKLVFEKDLDPVRILAELQILYDVILEAGKSLLIFDEVQECSRALTAMKYFFERMPGFHVIAAGSLLGLKSPKETSFPVGKIEILNVFPFTIREFFDALGHKKLLESLLILGSKSSATLHLRAIEVLKVYLFVGGMPEAVALYIKSKDLKEVRILQQSILIAYELDFSRHAEAKDAPKIRRIWQTLPFQLAKETKKFSMTDLGTGARFREYEIAFQWLQDAHLVHRCNRIEALKLPLAGYAASHAFKLYCLDVGLLGAMSALDSKTLVQTPKGVFEKFKGAMAENLVAQELAAQGIKAHFWASENKAEVDFVFALQGELWAAEVKSGTNLRSRSLEVLMLLQPKAKTLKLSLQPLEISKKMAHIPLYAMEILKNL